MVHSPPSSDVEIVHRSCSLCEAHCGLEVHVDRAKQQVVTNKGDPLDAMSHGYICPKAYALKGLQEDPDRLRTPVRKVGDAFQAISWDEAFDLIVSKLQAIRDAHGANSIATYLGNPNAHDFGSTLSVTPFLRALGTRWRFSATSVDQLPKMVSSCLLFGSPGTFAIPDVDRTDFLLVLGANPLVSNGSLMTAPDMPGRLRALRERAGKLVVVDPRRSETAAIADNHLRIRPGTDALFLFAIVHVLFDEDLVDTGEWTQYTSGVEALGELAREFSPEAVAGATGIEAEAIRQLARDFSAAPSAACYGRIGTCTQEFGTLASWLVDVVNTLTGNLDRPGGVMFPWPAHGAADPKSGRSGRVPYARWRSRVRGLPEFAGELPVAALAEEIDTPGDERVRALFTVAGNPVCSTPNSDRLDAALGELDFMVSVDIYVNETTRHADVILPTTTPLERSNYDMVFHGLSVRNHAKWSEPALPKPEGARHVWEILNEISGRMHGADAAAADEMVLDSLLQATVGEGKACPDLSPDEARSALGERRGPERILDLMLRAGLYGNRFRANDEGLSLDRLIDSEHGIDLGPLESRLPEMLATASGRVELAPDLLVEDVERLRVRLYERRGDELLLVGRRHIRNNNSWLHNVRSLAKGPNRCTLQIHPDDAHRLALENGADARVHSRVGEVVAQVEVTDVVMPGVVSLPHGFGHDVPGAQLKIAKTLQPGVNSNKLTDESLLDALSCNAVLNGIPVEVVRG
jgi:anaerobic selenocysteine-containing dehydrogenase